MTLVPYIPGASLGGRRADLGSVTLGAVDAAGVAWHLQGLDGWDGSDLSAGYQPREADHGAWAAPVYLRQRPVTITGKIEASGVTALDAAIEQLIAASSFADTTLTVYESIPKQATVRRSGPPLIKPITDRIAEYSVLVTAADPRRYSTDLQAQSAGLPSVTGGVTLPLTMPLTITAGTSSGQISLSNAGSMSTRPTFTIDGPVADPVIVVQYPDSTVVQLAFSDTLGAGDQLVIDTAARSVVLNGSVSRRGYLSVARWPVIPPTSTVTVQWTASSYDSAALLTGTCRSAWM
ncbi:hypothetical protein ABZY44_23930 [Streptomyces sp. NPDC006544]|uniref:hypothetical protein n=1 Tax=Streptomyces sp. NPDC006544 TaxID=3154583 RepID=UPI0033AC7C31